MSYADKSAIAGPSGSQAAVDNNALRVTMEDRWKYAVKNGNAFSWSSLTYDPGAGDTILAVENNDASRSLYIKKIIVSSDTASEIKVFGGRAVTMASAAGNAVIGTCLNRGAARVCTGIATAYDNETGNGEAAGSWATSYYGFRMVANSMVTLDVGGAIVLPNDNMIGVDFVAAATAGNVTIWGWYE